MHQTLDDLRKNLLSIPDAPGVYRIYWKDGQSPRFQRKTGGLRNDPATNESLTEKWIVGERLVYIGMASISLRQRIRQLLRYGLSLVDNHRGGRYLWQIEGIWENAMLEFETCRNPKKEESEMLQKFFDGHGRLPYANLRF